MGRLFVFRVLRKHKKAKTLKDIIVVIPACLESFLDLRVVMDKQRDSEQVGMTNK